MKKTAYLLLSFFILLLSVEASCDTLPPPAITKIDALINRELANKSFPGASFLVGNREGILYAHSYGYHDYSREQPVTPRSIYDIASCTKVLSTTFAMMRLYDERKITLTQTVGEFLPAYKETPIGSITVQELLTHTSGLRTQVFYPMLVHESSGNKLFSGTLSSDYPHQIEKNLYISKNVEFDTIYMAPEPMPSYRPISPRLYVNPSVDEMIYASIVKKYNPARKGTYQYDDTNFYILKQIIESVSGENLETFTQKLYDEMEGARIGYRPLEWADLADIVPTEIDYLLQRDTVHGYVHDELAAISGGVGGNAGLFATTEDMARFCQMIVSDGLYNNRRIISKETIDLFTNSPLAQKGIYRGLGFDKRSPQEGALGGERLFGHTGFTGTIFWINQEKGFYMIFLSNRVHPSRVNNQLSTSGLRTKLWETVSAYL